MKKDRMLFYYLILFLLMTLGAFTWQMFFPSVAGQFSLWGFSRGWQTEIALWNLSLDVGIIVTLLQRNKEYAKVLALVSTLLCLTLGGHHLLYALSAMDGNKALHWMGAVEVLLVGGGAGIYALVKSQAFSSLKD